jgi:hypothetical protein
MRSVALRASLRRKEFIFCALNEQINQPQILEKTGLFLLNFFFVLDLLSNFFCRLAQQTI